MIIPLYRILHSITIKYIAISAASRSGTSRQPPAVQPPAVQAGGGGGSVSNFSPTVGSRRPAGRIRFELLGTGTGWQPPAGRLAGRPAEPFLEFFGTGSVRGCTATAQAPRHAQVETQPRGLLGGASR